MAVVPYISCCAWVGGRGCQWGSVGPLRPCFWSFGGRPGEPLGGVPWGSPVGLLGSLGGLRWCFWTKKKPGVQGISTKKKNRGSGHIDFLDPPNVLKPKDCRYGRKKKNGVQGTRGSGHMFQKQKMIIIFFKISHFGVSSGGRLGGALWGPSGLPQAPSSSLWALGAPSGKLHIYLHACAKNKPRQQAYMAWQQQSPRPPRPFSGAWRQVVH